jgi:hypothetical protein
MGLGVIREYRCLEHGEFEASHPICPAMGCESRSVWQEFRTAPNIGTSMVRKHNAGMKRTSDMMRIANFRSARANESAYGGEKGRGLLWGDDCRKVLGRSFGELSGLAASQAQLGDLRRNNGMADTAEAAGVTTRRVAKPGELTGLKRDKTPTGAVITEATARQQLLS